MKRHGLELEPGHKPRPGISITGLVAVLILFVSTVALGHWVDNKANPPATTETKFETRQSEPHAVASRVTSQEISDDLAEPEVLSLVPAQTPVVAKEPKPQTRPAPRARAKSSNPVYRNDVTYPDRQNKEPDKSEPAVAAPSGTPKPAAKTSKPPTPARTVSAPAPPEVAASIKPPAQSNPAIKPTTSKPVTVDTAATPDKVVRVAPPADMSGADPFYTVRLNKADSKYLADVVADTLKEHGFDGAAAIPTGDGQYTVKVGDFNFRYAAENAKKQLKDLGFQETYIEEKTVAE